MNSTITDERLKTALAHFEKPLILSNSTRVPLPAGLSEALIRRFITDRLIYQSWASPFHTAFELTEAGRRALAEHGGTK